MEGHDRGEIGSRPGTGEGDVPDDRGVIVRWTEHLARQDEAKIGEPLPPHSPYCAGCGPRNLAGLGLRAVRTRTGVESVHAFSDAEVGAPGIAHGGAVALAFDDLFGFALYPVGLLAVTRSLTVDYQAPFRLHHPYIFRAEVTEREGRRLFLHAGAWDETGRQAGSADATFVVVGPQHFAGTHVPSPCQSDHRQ